jgi:hypothetical protein
MWQRRVLSTIESDRECDYRVRTRSNVIAAIITATLLITGAWLADELAETDQSCYPPDGGCEARGVPAPILGFVETMRHE